jgi:hypothetical protein
LPAADPVGDEQVRLADLDGRLEDDLFYVSENIGKPSNSG